MRFLSAYYVIMIGYKRNLINKSNNSGLKQGPLHKE